MRYSLNFQSHVIYCICFSRCIYSSLCIFYHYGDCRFVPRWSFGFADDWKFFTTTFNISVGFTAENYIPEYLLFLMHIIKSSIGLLYVHKHLGFSWNEWFFTFRSLSRNNSRYFSLHLIWVKNFEVFLIC